MTRAFLRAVAAACALGIGCGAPTARQDPPSTSPAAPPAAVRVIDHLAPRRDSSGPAPTRFEWTPVPGTDYYAFGIFNDIGAIVFRRDNIVVPTIALPPDVKLEFGTYFWSVTALKNDTPIGESGRSAFVVLQ